MRTIATLALALSATTAAAQMPPPPPGRACAPTLEMHRTLKERYGEHRAAVGLTQAGIIEIWTSDDGETFSVLATRPDGYSCMISSGEHYETVPYIVGDDA